MHGTDRSIAVGSENDILQNKGDIQDEAECGSIYRAYFPFLKWGYGSIREIEARFPVNEIIEFSNLYYSEDQKDQINITASGVGKALNLCFGGKDPEKEKADKEAREKARKNEFPHDVAYLYLRKDLVKTTEIIKSKTDGTPLLWKDKWQMWDEERLRAYFIPISKNTPIDIVLKKRCSAEGPLWELWKNFRDNGKHLTVELAKNYKEQYEEGERLMRDPSKALPPDKLFNSLKIR